MFMKPSYLPIKRSIQLAIFWLCLAMVPLLTNAQNKDSKGTDFWIAFPQNYQGTPVLSLFISGDENTTGTVSVPGIGFTQNFSVTSGNITTVVVPAGAQTSSNNAISNRGIRITAAKEVTVYALNRIQFTTDAFLALPIDILGTEYLISTFKNVGVVNGTQLTIVGTQDNTRVDITLANAGDGRPAGVPYQIVLNAGQVYQIKNSGSSTADLTGSVVFSDKPVAVFGSHECANIPDNNTFACDHIVEQLPPVSTWGQNFITVPLRTRTRGDTFRFLAAENGTQIRVNGVLAATINRGQFYQTLLTSASQITSSKPILVSQFSNGSSFDNVVSDPFMMLIPPYEQYLGNYTVSTPASGFSRNFINLVASNSSIGSIQLDNVIIPASSFTPVGSSGFSTAQLTVSLGVHRLTGGNLPFGVFVYGFDEFDSYGYPGGQSLSEVAIVRSILLTPETGTSAIGVNNCFKAVIKDQFNNAVPGVRVDFNIKGVNSASAGFAVTQSNGEATFCYVGAAVGRDSILASVGALADTSVFDWSAQACAVAANAQVLQQPTNGQSNGRIQVNATGGTGPYQYQLGTFSNGTGLFENLPAGSYAFTVTDNKLCTANGTIQLNSLPGGGGRPVACPADTVIIADPNTCTAAVSWNVPNVFFPDSIAINSDPYGNRHLILKGVYNGHGYYLSNGYYIWPDADQAAFQTKGHLVTITNQGESDFIFDKFPTTAYGPWIGVVWNNQNGAFQWSNGEPFVYTNWAAGEPNNQGGTEQFRFETFGHLWGYDPMNRWNDLGYFNYLPFIAEYDQPVIKYTQVSGPKPGDVVNPGIYEVCYEVLNTITNQTQRCCFTVTVKCSPAITCQGDSTIQADPITCKTKLMWKVPTKTFPAEVSVPAGFGGMGKMILGAVANNHGYYISTDKYPWMDAKAAANSVLAHLVTVTSPEENQVIYNYFRQSNNYGPWIGLRNTGTLGSFVWDNGEAFTYSNWAPNEPNNDGGTPSNIVEAFGHIMGYDEMNRWNDLTGLVYLPFIAEYDSPIYSYIQIEGPAMGTEVGVGSYRICYERTNRITGAKDTCCFTLTVVCNNSDKLLTENKDLNQTPLSESASRRVPNASEIATRALALKAVASPNPTRHQFSIRVESPNLKDKVTIQVVDLVGRRIEVKEQINPNTIVYLGDNYLPGVYITLIKQGEQTVMLKLVKQ
jgi:hypothetical protein